MLGETDLGGPAEEQVTLTGVTGALLVLHSSLLAAHKMELTTGTSSGTSSLWN